MAKGLEFDHVIIPFVDGVNYKTDLDKSLYRLYESDA